jgi:hypothetical protein
LTARVALLTGGPAVGEATDAIDGTGAGEAGLAIAVAALLVAAAGLALGQKALVDAEAAGAAIAAGFAVGLVVADAGAAADLAGTGTGAITAHTRGAFPGSAGGAVGAGLSGLGDDAADPRHDESKRLSAGGV